MNMQHTKQYPEWRRLITVTWAIATLSIICSATAAAFHATGSMTSPRVFHTATLLPNGLVLVAGGSAGDTLLATAELYDPGTETWTATGSMNDFLSWHTATLLTNGQVLVAGGYDGFDNDNGYDFYATTAELYDPATGTWTPTGTLHSGRAHHTATLLADGRVLIAGGGYDDMGLSVFSAEVYDPVSGNWTVIASMNDRRADHIATLLTNGLVLVAGGYGQFPDRAELFDPATGTWRPTGSMAYWHRLCPGIWLPNGKFLVAGGAGDQSAELYDPTTGTWDYSNQMTAYRVSHTGTLLPDGRVLVTGGYSYSPLVLPRAELYDPVTKTWAATAWMAQARASHTATLLTNGLVLVAGGNPNRIGVPAIGLSSAELYDVGAAPPSPTITNARTLVDGSFRFNFTDTSGTVFSVLATTNLALPASNWTVLDAPSELSPGLFQFTDGEATGFAQRYYRLSSP